MTQEFTASVLPQDHRIISFNPVSGSNIYQLQRPDGSKDFALVLILLDDINCENKVELEKHRAFLIQYMETILSPDESIRSLAEGQMIEESRKLAGIRVFGMRRHSLGRFTKSEETILRAAQEASESKRREVFSLPNSTAQVIATPLYLIAVGDPVVIMKKYALWYGDDDLAPLQTAWHQYQQGTIQLTAVPSRAPINCCFDTEPVLNALLLRQANL